MLGLVYKDMKVVLMQFRFLALIMLLYIGYSLYMKSLGFFSLMEPVLVIVMEMLAFGYDERCGWDKVACTFPVSRSVIVASRYLFGALLVVFTAVLHAVMTLSMKASPARSIELFIVSAGLVFGFMSIMFPILYRFGADKSRALFLIAFIGMLVASTLMSDDGFSLGLGLGSSIGLLAIVLVFYGLSLLCSIKMYSKMEFK